MNHTTDVAISENTSLQNTLAQEASLYLRQHAENPVAWQAWNDAALAKAKQENKPILLSIGYSACHWCHVMADESFADEETAQLMNDRYINIKVDREERPDLDKVYQTAHQLLSRRGSGWPLTVFLNPHNLTPYFSGMYFPKQAAGGLPAFKEILQKAADFYQANTAAINEQNLQLQNALTKLSNPETTPNGPLTAQPLLAGRRQLAALFDPVYGGFGNAPKFPQPSKIERLMRWYSHSKQHHDHSGLAMLQTTLAAMANGGIYDQLAGGFFRYTVDAAWRIPHFEKMLYDNAQLLAMYAQAHAFAANPLYQQITEETIAWLLEDMQAPQGGFYATLDADSEHKEGKYYYWDQAEVKSLLTKDEFAVAALYFGLDQSANFENHWHLQIQQNISNAAAKLNLTVKKFTALLTSAKQKLCQARSQRVRPGRDEKIITAWNALLIKGLALAGMHFSQPKFITLAQQTIDFIYKNLWVNQRLYANYQQGQARNLAYLDDYAFLLDALLISLQAQWRSKDLQFAIALAEDLLLHFEDKAVGGFFFTANDQEPLIQRPKPLQDEAIPAGNGIAALALLRLGHLLGETRYLQAAEKTLRMAWGSLINAPANHCSLLDALEEYLYPQIIILRGAEKSLPKWRELCQKHYSLQRTVYAIPEQATELPGVLAQQAGEKNKVLAYVCNGPQCLAPIDNLAKLEEILTT